jgi:hypothetical protein
MITSTINYLKKQNHAIVAKRYIKSICLDWLYCVTQLDTWISFEWMRLLLQITFSPVNFPYLFELCMSNLIYSSNFKVSVLHWDTHHTRTTFYYNQNQIGVNNIPFISSAVVVDEKNDVFLLLSITLHMTMMRMHEVCAKEKVVCFRS